MEEILLVFSMLALELRKHLLQCFESSSMPPFPSAASQKKKPTEKKLRVYCSCRLLSVLEHMKSEDVPKGEMSEMIRCNICECWYHHNCVGMTEDDVKKSKRIGKFWMCDYKGLTLLLLMFLWTQILLFMTILHLVNVLYIESVNMRI